MVCHLKARRRREIDILFEDGEASGTDEISCSELSESNNGIITNDEETDDENIALSLDTISCNESIEKLDKQDLNFQKHIYSTHNSKKNSKRQKYITRDLYTSKSKIPSVSSKKNLNSTVLNNTFDNFYDKTKTLQAFIKKSYYKEEKVELSKNKNYQKRIKVDPTFVPCIGSFFMHDRRYTNNSSVSSKKHKKYCENGYFSQKNKKKISQTKFLQNDLWTHDAFDMHDKDINVQFNNTQRDFGTLNITKGSKVSKEKSKIFNIRVKMPSSDVTKVFQKELTNHCNPILHQFLLREDKPVKIKFPEKSLKIVYPTSEHSCKFISKTIQTIDSTKNTDLVEKSRSFSFMTQHINLETSTQCSTLNNVSCDNHFDQSNDITNGLSNFSFHDESLTIPSNVSDFFPKKGLNMDSSVFSHQHFVEDTSKSMNDKTNIQQTSIENQSSESHISDSTIYTPSFQSNYRTSQQPLVCYFSTLPGHSSYFSSYYNTPSQYISSISSNIPLISTTSSNIHSVNQNNNPMIYYYDPMQYYYPYFTVFTASGYTSNRSKHIHSNHVSTKFLANSIVSYNSFRNNSNNGQGMYYYPQGYVYYTNEVTM